MKIVTAANDILYKMTLKENWSNTNVVHFLVDWKSCPCLVCISFAGASLTTNVTVPSGDAYPGACNVANPFPFNSNSKLHNIPRYCSVIVTCIIEG